MTPERSRAGAVLGVPPDADDGTLRRAFRRHLRSAHPDSGGSRSETERIVAAYALLRQKAQDRTPTDTSTSPDTESPETSLRDASMRMEDAHEDVFVMLLERLHDVGDVDYVDAETGLVEATIARHHRLTATLQGRLDHVEVMFTLESPDAASAPDLNDLARLLTMP